jgi:translocation and assembly module TamB
MIVLEGRNLRSPLIPAAIGPGSLTARADLRSNSAAVDAQISAGNAVQVNLNGTLPVDAQHEMAVRVTGNTDFAIFNAVLLAEGRKLLGRVSLDGALNGTFAAPRIEGHASLTGGEVQDIPRGFRVHDIVADAESNGMTVRLTRLSGTAGEGTVTATGTIDLSREAMPVNIVLTTRNARPLVSDRFAGTMDSNLRVTGDAKEQLTLAGDINLTRGEIHLPENYPPSVVALDVRRRGQAPPPREVGRKPFRLDLKVTSPGQVFVRGRGIDAEVQGEMRLTGTTDAPQVSGGLDLRRGTFTVAGQTLNFTRGRVTFTGASLQDEINPALDLVAENRSGNIDVQLAVTGVASAPRIQLTSTPSLPQDEILASLLFQQSTAQLNPFQLAEIAQAAISLTDAGRGLDPIAGLRKGLGLDRLAVGSVGGVGTTSTETQTTVTAGKYVARNIYVGATQGVSGGTQAEVQVDLTRNLKAIGTVNNGLPTNNTQQSRQHEESTSIGLRYQFEY